MNCLRQPALAETVKVDDVRSSQAALDKARVNQRMTRIGPAAGTYALRAPVVVDERLSGTAATPFVLANSSVFPRAYNVSASTRPGTSRSGMPRTSLAENWLTPRSANSAAPPCPRCRLTAWKLASLTSSSTTAVRPSGWT
jgi:hypothetical protein